MKRVTIRPERLEDYNAIRTLIVEVFSETYGSGEAEANIVEKLRSDPGDGPVLSLVAEVDGTLAGHIFFSAVRLTDFPNIPICTLAPLGIYRQYQRQGIGSKLVSVGLTECAKLGYEMSVTQGSLEYYQRFGFKPIAKTKLHTTFNSDHDMVMAFTPNLLAQVSGLVDFPEPWLAFA